MDTAGLEVDIVILDPAILHSFTRGELNQPYEHNWKSHMIPCFSDVCREQNMDRYSQGYRTHSFPDSVPAGLCFQLATKPCYFTQVCPGERRSPERILDNVIDDAVVSSSDRVGRPTGNLPHDSLSDCIPALHWKRRHVFHGLRGWSGVGGAVVAAKLRGPVGCVERHTDLRSG